MKKVFSFILIAALVFPLFGHVSAAATPAIPTQSAVAPDQKALVTALKDIYTRLNTLSNQTQSAIDQLNTNGIVTTQSELDLVNANAALAKAKTTIDKIAPQTSPDAFKAAVTAAEGSLKEGRINILNALSDLKAVLPAFNTSNK